MELSLLAVRRQLALVSSLAVTLTAVAAATASIEAQSPSTASRIIDRTLVCRMTGIGYPDSLRYMTVSATPYEATTNTSPQISASNGTQGIPGAGVYVRTGPAGRENETPTGEVSMTRKQTGRCANTRLRVRLSSRGLVGGPTGPDRKWYRCDVPAKVLVRVRAVFTRPTAFTVDQRFRDTENARGIIKTGYIAVTTLSGRKPIAFASAQHATGKARIFVARSGCDPLT
jgi:hypothetical protein